MMTIAAVIAGGGFHISPNEFFLGYVGGAFYSLPSSARAFIEPLILLRYPEVLLGWLAALLLYKMSSWRSLPPLRRLAPSVVVMGTAPVLAAVLQSVVFTLSLERPSVSAWAQWVLPGTLLLFAGFFACPLVLATEIGQVALGRRWYPSWIAKMVLFAILAAQVWYFNAMLDSI